MPIKVNSIDPSEDAIRDATIMVLRRVIDPLIDLMFDAGITTHDFTRLIRDMSVRSAAVRLSKQTGRDSKSRVAIITGLPRSAVSQILASKADLALDNVAGQHPARRVLAAWYDDPRYLSENGEPAVIPVFGKRRSFERLVAAHCGGIPVRAMLDELLQIEAVEIYPNQHIRAKSRVPIFTGLTTSAINAIGERASDLLKTLKHNVRPVSKPLFEGTALFKDIAKDAVPLLRRELAEQGTAFLQSANSLLSRSRIKPDHTTGASKECRVGVTVYYFQDKMLVEDRSRSKLGTGQRKNLQRRNRSIKTKLISKTSGTKPRKTNDD